MSMTNKIIYDDNSLFNLNSLTISKNSEIIFYNIALNHEISIDVKEDVSLVIKGVLLGDNLNLKLSLNLLESSQIEGFFVDFSQNKSEIDVNINLNGINSNATFKSASLATNKDNKIFNVNVNHNFISSKASVFSYGVCKDASNLVILGTSDIKEEMVNCETSQNAKIMLVDKDSYGIAKPILKISNNDVKASHGASIGQLNEDHLFYLCSRGLKENEAKRLIISGYFNQIIDQFKNDEFYDDITSLLNARI